MILIILSWNSKIFIDFRNPRVEFNDFHACHNSPMKFNDRHDFNDSRMKFCDVNDIPASFFFNDSLDSDLEF